MRNTKDTEQRGACAAEGSTDGRYTRKRRQYVQKEIFLPFASAKPTGRFSSFLLHYESEYKEQYCADTELNHTVWHKTFAQFHRVYTCLLYTSDAADE